MHRSKVNEVEKLSTTIRDLEEAVLAGGAAVNAARDFQRQVHELMVRRIFIYIYGLQILDKSTAPMFY